MDINYYKKYEPIDGKWYITKELGSGAFGTVFEIERRDFTNEKSALKIITIPASSSEVANYREENYTLDEQSISSYFYGFVEEFVKEFKLMSKLKGNSNIVSIEDYDVMEHTDEIGWDILIRMELLTPMNKYFAQNSPKTRDVIKLGIDICKALEVCQKFNIVHRDIKPSNIFVSGTGEFKLGDFGVARTLEKTSSGLSKKGTYTYMAPEVYKGESYNSNVDIYSLGIVMYRLLNNNMEPFKEGLSFVDADNALVRRMKGEDLPKPANAQGRLAEIILKACSFNSKDRYESPLQMRSELESICPEDVAQGVIEDGPGREVPGIFDTHIMSQSEYQKKNNEIFHWDASVMDINELEYLSLSYGDCPIVKMKFDGSTVTKCNRINGSRDGWMSFPEGFFDEKSFSLSASDAKKIYTALKAINFKTWHTEDHIIKNYTELATGFCVHDALEIKFKNGVSFLCLYPACEEFENIIGIMEAITADTSDGEITIGLFDIKAPEDDNKTVGIFDKKDTPDSETVDTEGQNTVEEKKEEKKKTPLKGILTVCSVVILLGIIAAAWWVTGSKNTTNDDNSYADSTVMSDVVEQEQQEEAPVVENIQQEQPAENKETVQTTKTQSQITVKKDDLAESEVHRHKEVVIPAVAATCTATGKTEGIKCSDCNAVLKEQEIIPRIAHSEVIIPAVDATCQKTGNTEGKKCSICNTIIEVAKKSDKKPHDFNGGDSCKWCGTEPVWEVIFNTTKRCALGESYKVSGVLNLKNGINAKTAYKAIHTALYYDSNRRCLATTRIFADYRQFTELEDGDIIESSPSSPVTQEGTTSVDVVFFDYNGNRIGSTSVTVYER